jgi:hypothetical protein
VDVAIRLLTLYASGRRQASSGYGRWGSHAAAILIGHGGQGLHRVQDDALLPMRGYACGNEASDIHDTASLIIIICDFDIV